MKRTATYGHLGVLVEKKKKHKRQRSKTPQPGRQRKQPTFKSNDPATKDTTKTYSTTRKSKQDIFDEYAAREPLGGKRRSRTPQLRQTRQEPRDEAEAQSGTPAQSDAAEKAPPERADRAPTYVPRQTF